MRKKLIKFLGKRVEYTAQLGIKSDSVNQCYCITDVRQNGKFMTDHVWVTGMSKLDKLEVNTKVVFTAVAYTYTDSKGIRKHGLREYQGFEKYVNDEHSIHVDIAKKFKQGSKKGRYWKLNRGGR